MNSMFSSFDALCAEFLGQMVKASFPTQQKSVPVFNNKAAVSDTLNTKQEGNGEALPQAQVKKQRSPPRFALELDGLNCFETIVSR